MSPVTTVATSSAHLTSFDLDLTSTVTAHLMNSTATHQPSPVETVTSYITSDSYLSSFTISHNMSSYMSISISPSHPSDPSDDGEERRSNKGISVHVGVVVAVILLVTAVTIIVVAVLVLVLHRKRSKKAVDVQHKEQNIADSVKNAGIGADI